MAFGKDKRGEVAVRALMELLPQSFRIKCTAIDWNQQLLDYGQQLRQQQPQKEDDLSL
ncbi:hypothetical protein [Nostoc sp. FACHB-133]|uniref:hypothetical protein n=1 Tax=Nostoc sp. FACHB-133 TaxID=2692835 RepID=UPI00168420BC|nr:hypothetical protein [Nostoc sp. FACHB-133]MBD2527948.1 hypothetical protein [Nostoc sp. FACHB-133]